MRFADLLDAVQTRLHDAGAIWPRTELLGWANDGYRQMVAQSQCAGRLTILEVPGRLTIARTQEWEARYSRGGTSFKWTYTTRDGRYECSFPWEVQFLAGLTPEPSTPAYTHPWERGFVAGSQEFTFALPRNHERIRGVWWNHERLEPVTTRELDATETEWMTLPGTPTHWTPGLQRNRMFDIYCVATTYQQAYSLRNGHRGIPRHWRGDRQYTAVNQHGIGGTVGVPGSGGGWVPFGWVPFGWVPFASESVVEKTAPFLGSGLVRRVTSEHRAYWPTVQGHHRPPRGIGRDWRSSVNALLVWESIIPSSDAIDEDDTPALMPPPTHRYLRDYVLSQAYGRTGEGQNLRLAEHYQARVQRGIALLRKLADMVYRDRAYTRGQTGYRRGRQPTVQLPHNFPAVR